MSLSFTPLSLCTYLLLKQNKTEKVKPGDSLLFNFPSRTLSPWYHHSNQDHLWIQWRECCSLGRFDLYFTRCIYVDGAVKLVTDSCPRLLESSGFYCIDLLVYLKEIWVRDWTVSFICLCFMMEGAPNYRRMWITREKEVWCVWV